MDQVGKMKAACSHYLLHNKYLREYQGPASDDHKRHKEVQHGKIGYFLKRVELSSAVYRIRSFLSLEYAEKIISCLSRDLFFQPASSHPVIESIMSEHISEEHYKIID